ncbi:MAG: toll/interleukin-1 receptor domain-containing protein, partial [Aggregatilineales bacterium]
MNRVFISYSRKNEAFAERLARDLGDAGLDVWLDLRQIQGGENWRDEIFRGLERSEFLVALLSPAAVESKWVQREILTARDQGKRIYPIMVEDARDALRASEELKWLRDTQYIDFEASYEEAFPKLLEALPGGRAIGSYDIFDPESIPNPFKGLEAFQQRDAALFFGREELVARALQKLRHDDFLAVLGASGSGKSSLVRAGIIPQIRNGALPGSETYPILIFTPGEHPLDGLATRLHPLLAKHDSNRTRRSVLLRLQNPEQRFSVLTDALAGLPENAKLLLMIDQFEEVFTRSGEKERENFLDFIRTVASVEENRTVIMLTMRSDFLGQLGGYPALAEMLEGDRLLIVTEMTTANLLRVIEGPAQAVGLEYEDGLVDRILEDVKAQPGSLPLLQYALRELYQRRDGATLTISGYNDIGGVRQALARHAEGIFQVQTQEDQELIRRILLRLVEVSETGEATRRRIPYAEIEFRNTDPEKIDEMVALLTAPDARLLVANQEITTGEEPTIWLEVSHEALIREWERFKSWVSASAEDLQYESELRKAAADWEASGREASYLLTGKRLTRAEVWTDGHDLLSLQDELIDASLLAREVRQQAEKQRAERELVLQRQSTNRARIVAGSTVLLLIVAAFSLFNVAQANDALAQTNQDLEESESNLANTVNDLEDVNLALGSANDALGKAVMFAEESEAEARSLAVSSNASRAYSDNQPDLAVSLALAANESPNAPIVAELTLSEIAFAPGTQARFADVGRVSAVAISPDNMFIGAGLRNGA